MKNRCLLVKCVIALLVVSFTACKSVVTYETIDVDAPFPMEPIKVCVFPEQDFVITEYGAVADGEHNNSDAIAKAISACNEAGGGRVVIPSGNWVTGPIHYKSNVNLHLQEGAVLCFTDNPKDYLPAVMTSWEGMECYNYSPLIYAFDCENIALTGKGKLQPRMDTWKVWFARPKAHMDALAELYHQMSKGVPVEERRVAVGENNFRPHLIHWNRCRNVLLDGIQIEGSPFWTIHMYMCEGGVARNLNVNAHGHNNDGIDLEMTRNFLVENCTFSQGDDAVVIKSGRNQDAWRLNMPSENIVIRNCTILAGHVLLGVGSEMAGGVRNVYMHDCVAPNSVHRLMFLKTNHRRGGFIENIHMKNVKTGSTLRVLEIDTDVLYQWRKIVPTYEERITKINGIYMSDVQCGSTKMIYDLKGDERLPIQNVNMRNVHVESVSDSTNHVIHAEHITIENVTFDKLEINESQDLKRYENNK